MKLQVRSLNSGGIDVFAAWLKNKTGPAPVEILDDQKYSDDIAASYNIDPSRQFDTSYQLGKYLHETVFVNVPDAARLSAETGIWAWISLAFIDSLLARSASRKGKPLNLPHYIEVASQQG